MGTGVTIVRNDISPAIKKVIQTAKPEARKRILTSMGNTFKSITQGNFQSGNAGMRPVPWPNKKDGSVATLKKSRLLAGSFHLETNSEQTVLSNPTPYAAIHQYGGKTKPHRILPKKKKALAFGGGVYGAVNHPGSNIPARPFFPVDKAGHLTAAAEKLILASGQRTANKIAGIP